MGRYSFVLAGAEGAMSETFDSSAHGAGRGYSIEQPCVYLVGELCNSALVDEAPNHAVVRQIIVIPEYPYNSIGRFYEAQGLAQAPAVEHQLA